MSIANNTVKVWDPIVRIGHWTLVIAFFTAYFTEEDFMTQHIWAGYVVTGVVVFRIVWGLIGTQHAKFKDFIYSPSAVLGYLKGLSQRKPQHYLGHNPAGGAMVIALLVSLLITTYSGLALYAVEDNAGPFASIYGNTLSMTNDINANKNEGAESEQDEANEHQPSDMHQPDSDKEGIGGTGYVTDKGEHESVNEGGEEFWEGLHEFFANFTLFLVILHITGVILSSRIDKENLAKAMVTGYKEVIKE
jgi:cytochrome b